MGELDTSRVIRLPIMLCALMLAIGFATALAAGIDAADLPLDYVVQGLLFLPLAVFAAFLVELARLARAKDPHPTAALLTFFRSRFAMLVLPGIIFPLFLAGFTVAKTSIHFIVGFRWDGFWADADRLILGQDGWRYTHALLGSFATASWAWVYTFAWGFILASTKSFVALYGRPKFIATFYTAMMLTWLVGGWLIAFCFSAAGPVFAHLYEPELTERFAPLRASLQQLLAHDNAVRETQAYLSSAADRLTAVRGGGISAMPSMHLGACAIYVIAARGTRWLIPAILFWIVIFVGSVHFGYHYALDGIIASGLALLCWQTAAAFYRDSPRSAEPSRILEPAL